MQGQKLIPVLRLAVDGQQGGGTQAVNQRLDGVPAGVAAGVEVHHGNLSFPAELQNLLYRRRLFMALPNDYNQLLLLPGYIPDIPPEKYSDC